MTAHETATAAGRSAGPNNQTAWWYEGRCSCGWTGPPRNTEERADNDIAEHHTNHGGEHDG